MNRGIGKEKNKGQETKPPSADTRFRKNYSKERGKRNKDFSKSSKFKTIEEITGNKGHGMRMYPKGKESGGKNGSNLEKAARTGGEKDSIEQVPLLRQDGKK